MLSADFIAQVCGEGMEAGNDFRVVWSEVGPFVDVLVEVVEAWLFFLGVDRFRSEIFGLRGEGEFPRTLTDGLEGVAGEVEVGLAWGDGGFAEEQRGDVPSVDLGFGGNGATGE